MYYTYKVKALEVDLLLLTMNLTDPSCCHRGHLRCTKPWLTDWLTDRPSVATWLRLGLRKVVGFFVTPDSVSSPSGVMVNNAWNFTPTPLDTFIMCCLDTDKTLYFEIFFISDITHTKTYTRCGHVPGYRWGPTEDRCFANVKAGQGHLTARENSNIIQTKYWIQQKFLMTVTQIPKFLVTGSFNKKNCLTYHCTVLSKVYFVNMLGADASRITTFYNKVRDCKPTVIYL
jgi:hypothetical protein